MTESDTEELKDDGEPQHETEDLLVTLSEAASAFSGDSLKFKIDNSVRRTKIKKFGIPDLRWTTCPKIDTVVLVNISRDTDRTNRTTSHLQLFWLDAMAPIVMVLERAEEFSLPPEAINMIQTSLHLMNNANYHHSTECRKALLQHLNPLLKQLVEESDFKEAPPMVKILGCWLNKELRLQQHLRKPLRPIKGNGVFSRATLERIGAAGMAVQCTAAKEEVGSPGETKFPRRHNSQRND